MHTETVFCTPLKGEKKSTAVIIITFSGLLLSVIELLALDFLGYRAEAPSCRLSP